MSQEAIEQAQQLVEETQEAREVAVERAETALSTATSRARDAEEVVGIASLLENNAISLDFQAIMSEIRAERLRAIANRSRVMAIRPDESAENAASMAEEEAERLRTSAIQARANANEASAIAEQAQQEADEAFRESGEATIDAFEAISANEQAIEALQEAQENCLEDPGTAEGDPHITTFDGLNYDFQAVGEFTFVESIEGGYEVQVAVENGLHPEFPFGSYITEVAIAINDSVISFDSSKNQIRHEGILIEIGESETLNFDNFILSSSIENGFTIALQSEELLSIDLRERQDLGFNFYNLAFTPSEAEVIGLLGNNNGNPVDDLALRDGTTLNPNSSTRDLRGDFADSWRLDKVDSFLYESDAEITDELSIEIESVSNSFEYNPYEEDGLFFKSKDNQFQLEFNGNSDGSRFRGSILFDSPIDSLERIGIERSDTVELSENRQTIEFDLRVLNQWTDTLGFNLPENSSFSLQVESGPINVNIPKGDAFLVYTTQFVNFN